MEKESKVEALFDFICTDEDGQADFVCWQEMHRIASLYPEEFDALVNLFNGLEEDTFLAIAVKLSLSDVLARLKYEPVKEFFIRVIHDPRTSSSEGDYEEFIYEDKVAAAVNLVAMGDERGLPYLEEIYPKLNEYQSNWLVCGLYGSDYDDAWRCKAIGLRFILDAADKQKYISKMVDGIGREKIEKKLAKLEEPNPFKRLHKKIKDFLNI